MTPDERLSAAERAALADLEAAAAAADPTLAARLKGRRLSRFRFLLPTRAPQLGRVPQLGPVSQLGRWWAALVGIGWWGVPLAVAGLVLVVLGLVSSLAVSVVGALVLVVGLRVIADLVERRLAARRRRQDGEHPEAQP